MIEAPLSPDEPRRLRALRELGVLYTPAEERFDRITRPATRLFGAPSIRFYTGHPLHAEDGSNLGTLCVIDTKPRTLSPKDVAALSDLAAIAESELK